MLQVARCRCGRVYERFDGTITTTQSCNMAECPACKQPKSHPNSHQNKLEAEPGWREIV